MIRRIRESLMLKWMVFSILLATIPLVIAGFSITQIYQDNLKKSVVEVEKEKANILVGRTRSFFERITSNLRSLSVDEHFREGSSIGHIRSLLESFLNRHDYLSELTLLDEKGKETIKVSKYKVFKSPDLKDQSNTEMFRAASNLQTYYGDFKLMEDVVPSITVAIPIEEYRKRPMDVLSAEIDIRYLWNLIPQIQMGQKGKTYVVDGAGYVIAHPDTGRVTSRMNVRHLPMVALAVAGEEGNLEFEDSEGEKYLVVYKPIKELGWGVIVQVPVKEVYAPLRQVTHTALKWIFIALSIAIIFSLYLTRKLTRPVKQLSQQMAKVSEGSLDVEIAATRKDELGILMGSFNRMIQDLKKSQEALRKTEEKYRRIFEDSKDMVYIASVDQKLLEINQAGMDMLGYDDKEALFQVEVKDTYLNREDHEKVQSALIKEGYIKDFETRLKRKDGTPIDVLITSIARRDDSGHITRYEGTIKNITHRKKMEEELLQRTRELEALNEMGALVNQTLVNIDTVFPIVLEKAMSLTGFEMGAIFLLNEEANVLERKFHAGEYPAMGEVAKMLKYGEGISGKAFALRQPIIAPISEDSPFQVNPGLVAKGVRTLVGFPLLAKGKTIGTITLSSHSPRNLDQREISLLGSIGNQIGLALENAKLFSETKKRLEESTILYEITKISTSSLTLDQMLREITDHLNHFFKFERLGILLMRE